MLQEKLLLLFLTQQTCFKSPDRKTDTRGQVSHVSSQIAHIPYIHGLTETQFGLKGKNIYIITNWLKPKHCQIAKQQGLIGLFN